MASRQSRSKKQSAGSRQRQLSLPEDFVLYLDENLHNCKPILDVLAQHQVKLERHGHYFAPGTEDSDWLPFVGQHGWILLTKASGFDLINWKRLPFGDIECASFTSLQEISPEQKWRKYWSLLFPE